jgi:hypothetical protein
MASIQKGEREGRHSWRETEDRKDDGGQWIIDRFSGNPVIILLLFRVRAF